MPEKKMIILRGIPGSGKTTYTQRVLEQAQEVICSADHYFIREGVYQFSPADIGKAHEASQQKARKLCSSGAKTLIIDNTNTKKWEFEPYLKMAAEYGYTVEVVRFILPCKIAAKRNLHGVPEKNVERMMERFEDYPGESLLNPVNGEFNPI